VVEQLPEHELAYGSEPAWERGEGEAVVEQQPPRASGCKATTSSRGQRLGVVEALLPEKHQTLLPGAKCRSGFTTLPPVPLQEQPAVVLLSEELRSHKVLVIREYGGHEDLHGSGSWSIIPYVHG
jgi:hypothetical protein